MRKNAFHVVSIWGEILVVIGTAGGQTLKKETGAVSPQVQMVYNSPEYDRAYRAAELIYDGSRPKPYAPYPWNPKNPFLWVGFKEKEMGKYTLDLDEFKGRLNDESRNSSIKNDPEKLAQLDQVKNRLTEENLSALNVLIGAVDLSTFFTRNHRPDLARLWTPWHLPEDKPGLDEDKMEDVHQFVSNIIKCLSETRNYHVQFSKSSNFSNVVPLGADGTPMTRQEAAVFWQFNNNAPVDRAIANLYDALHTAQIAAAKEGLLGDSPLR